LIGGGGRYDELTRLIGAEEETPAVGFAYYVDEMATLLDQAAIDLFSVALVVDESSRETAAIHWACALRERGVRVILGDEAGSHRVRVLDGERVQLGDQIYSDVDALLAELDQQS